MGNPRALTHLFYGGNGTTTVESGLPSVGVQYGVEQNGDLLWYRYDGQGEKDPSGSTGWAANSGTTIGNAWQSFRQISGCGNGVILAIRQNGDLHWYRHNHHEDGSPGEDGSPAWDPNSGNQIGNGWLFQTVFVTPQEGTAPGRLGIYAVAQNGDLLWYSYSGNGEKDPSGRLG